MQRVSEGESVVFCGAAARRAGGGQPPPHIKTALASKWYYLPHGSPWPRCLRGPSL